MHMIQCNDYKRLLIVFSAIIIAVAITTQTVIALNADEDYTYMVNEDGTATLVSYNGSEKDIVVPDSIEGIAVTKLENTFYGNDSIHTVTVSEGINIIEEYTFSNCPELTYIKIMTPGDLYIRTSAFYDSDKLKLINIKTNDVYIDSLDDLRNERYIIASVGSIKAKMLTAPRIVYIVIVIVDFAVFSLVVYLVLRVLLSDPKGYVKYRSEVFNGIDIVSVSDEELRMVYNENRKDTIRETMIIVCAVVVCFPVFFVIAQMFKYDLSTVFIIRNPMAVDLLFTIIIIIIPLIIMSLIIIIKQKNEEKHSIYSKSKMKVSKG